MIDELTDNEFINDDAAVSPVVIAGGILDYILDEMFPAEKAAADIISVLLDQVMTSVKRRGLSQCSFS